MCPGFHLLINSRWIISVCEHPPLVEMTSNVGSIGMGCTENVKRGLHRTVTWWDLHFWKPHPYWSVSLSYIMTHCSLCPVIMHLLALSTNFLCCTCNWIPQVEHQWSYTTLCSTSIWWLGAFVGHALMIWAAVCIAFLYTHHFNERMLSINPFSTRA